jgi:hypothetical protein
VHARQFIAGRIRIRAIWGKQPLADLSRNEQVEEKKVTSPS